jgi:hypothetical protein
MKKESQQKLVLKKRIVSNFNPNKVSQVKANDTGGSHNDTRDSENCY